jgi:hypothetical protein
VFDKWNLVTAASPMYQLDAVVGVVTYGHKVQHKDPMKLGAKKLEWLTREFIPVWVAS